LKLKSLNTEKDVWRGEVEDRREVEDIGGSVTGPLIHPPLLTYSLSLSLSVLRIYTTGTQHTAPLLLSSLFCILTIEIDTIEQQHTEKLKLRWETPIGYELWKYTHAVQCGLLGGGGGGLIIDLY
jgi:hypothetical protein